jgi:hypothetical protein
MHERNMLLTPLREPMREVVKSLNEISSTTKQKARHLVMKRALFFSARSG